MRYSRGFTLVELMIAIAVLAVILGMAVPAFTDMIRSHRAQTQSVYVASALNFARNEAVKRSGVVSVVSSTWAQGWQVGLDNNGDGDLTDTGELLIRQFPALKGTGVLLKARAYTTVGSAITRGAEINRVRFGPQGQMMDLAPAEGPADLGEGSVLEFTIGDSYCSLGRDIFVNQLGRVATARKVCP